MWEVTFGNKTSLPVTKHNVLLEPSFRAKTDVLCGRGAMHGGALEGVAVVHVPSFSKKIPKVLFTEVLSRIFLPINIDIFAIVLR